MSGGDLRIHVEDRELSADWVDGAPNTRAALADVLPVDGDATRWGDELYFRVPVDVPAENASADVPIGAVAYWPQGNALCLFWGPTPASVGTEPRAASPVTVVASIDDVSPLASLSGGATVRLEAID